MAEQQPVAWGVAYQDGLVFDASTGADAERYCNIVAEKCGWNSRAIPLYPHPREELPRCPRCLKIISGEGVHTCTPTAAWRELERQRDDLLSTLERLRGSFQFGEFDGIAPEGCERAVKFIDAAIASVKGGAA